MRERLELRAHDVFTPAPALGHHAGNIYSRLDTTPLPLHDLATTLRTNAYELAGILDALAHHGLVAETRQGWRRLGAGRRDTAATVLRVTGTIAARRLLYQLEREMWEWWLSELQWMTASRDQKQKRPAPGQLTLAAKGDSSRFGSHPRRAGGFADFTASRQLLSSATKMTQAKTTALAA